MTTMHMKTQNFADEEFVCHHLLSWQQLCWLNVSALSEFKFMAGIEKAIAMRLVQKRKACLMQATTKDGSQA